MLKLSFSLFVLLSSLAFGQSPEAQAQFNKQVEVRRDEAKPVVALYLELFKSGPSVEGLNKLGAEYLKQSKPIQAQVIFKNALALDANSEVLKTNLATTSEMLDKKNTMMATFEASEQVENNPQHACSRASILFHLGFMGDAVDLLLETTNRFPTNQDVAGLLNTFKMGIAVDTVVVKSVLREFSEAIQVKNQDRAESCIAEYQFFSLGTGDPSRMVDKVGEVFGAEAKAKVKEILLKAAS